MKHLLSKCIFILFMLSAFFLQAQRICERTYSGTMTDNVDGSPLPGVNVVIKGTNRGTVTDVSGKYQIKVCPGDILVFMYIGYDEVEVEVTEAMLGVKSSIRDGNENALTEADIPTLYPEHKNKKKVSLQELLKTKRKVVVPQKNKQRFSENSPVFLKDGKVSQTVPYNINTIKLTQKTYNIKSTSPTNLFHRSSLAWRSTLQFDQVGKLPALQQDYAQGRSENGAFSWRGAIDNEPFSWGPLMRLLEYDGIATAYNPNGSLVPDFSGNGQPALSYDGSQLFQRSVTQYNTIQLSEQSEGHSVLLNYRNLNRRNLIFPDVQVQQHEFYGRGKIKWSNKDITIYPQLYYVNSRNKPFSHGAMATIVGSAYLTPISFDNTAGTSVEKARNVTTTYELTNGTPRSFAPNTFDNPFWLLEKNPNGSSTNRLIGGTKLVYHFTDRFTLNYLLGIEVEHQKNQFGIAPFSATMPEGRLTNRSERMRQYSSSLLLHGKFKPMDDLIANATFKYSFMFTNRDLNRVDGEGFTGASAYEIDQAAFVHRQDIDQNRSVHQVLTEVEWDYKSFLFLKTVGQLYASSTLDKPRVNVSGISATMDFTTAFPSITYSNVFDYLKLYANYGTTIKEADLSYGSFHYESTQQSLQEAFNFYGAAELTIPMNLQPKEVSSYEIGLMTEWFYDRVLLSGNYYHRVTKNAIYPVWTGNAFELQNVGEIKNEGFEAQLTAEVIRIRDFKFYVDGIISTDRPVVTALYGQRDRVQLAGFREVSTNLIEGEPFGVIMGTDYQKTANGQTIIGADGFPLVDNTQRVIGNPTPNFRGVISPRFSYRGIDLSLIWSFQNGGERWNGTQQALDYYGRSAITGADRDIRNYVFEGVLQDGSTNTKAVDFYNPANSIEENRWVRYGPAGVGKEYIQQTSWFRLTEINLSYDVPQRMLGNLPFMKLEAGIYGRNLFLNTAYTGVDPETTLFGYNEGDGLDYFNTPTTKQYGFYLHVVF